MTVCRHYSTKNDGIMAEKTYTRLIRPPGQSFFLLGVRGVGKSTWARRQFPDAPHIDLLDETRYQDYLVDPSLFAADLQSSPPGSWVVSVAQRKGENMKTNLYPCLSKDKWRFRT